jgi:hypothetical protein
MRRKRRGRSVLQAGIHGYFERLLQPTVGGVVISGER